jgi:uncharacterized protein YcfJ
MNRKVVLMTGVLVLASMSGLSAQARHGAGYNNGAYVDYARVVRVKPVYRVMRVATPRRECWNEERAHRVPARRSRGREIVGGIIGGALGSRLGKGKGRIVGAVTGVIIGSSLARDTRPPRGARVVRDVHRVCRRTVTHHEEERLDSYIVTYRYRGVVRTTRMSHAPGRRIRVRVNVEPIDR